MLLSDFLHLPVTLKCLKKTIRLQIPQKTTPEHFVFCSDHFFAFIALGECLYNDLERTLKGPYEDLNKTLKGPYKDLTRTCLLIPGVQGTVLGARTPPPPPPRRVLFHCIQKFSGANLAGKLPVSSG